MKFEALFIDLDGTLLTDHYTISAGTKEVLEKLYNTGVLVCIVTARSPVASLPFYEQLGIPNNPIVCFNGALIQKANLIMHDVVIKKNLAMEIVTVLNLYKIVPSIYKHNQWFAALKDEWLAKEEDITKAPLTKVVFNELFGNGIQPNKIMGIGNTKSINAAEAHIKNTWLKDLNVHQSKPTYLEITNSKASKMQGIQKVLELYKIDRNKIITIGDNYNDMDMLRFSKTSIAMGNAPDEVKKCATFVTDTNNNDGIKKALVRIME